MIPHESADSIHFRVSQLIKSVSVGTTSLPTQPHSPGEALLLGQPPLTSRVTCTVFSVWHCNTKITCSCARALFFPVDGSIRPDSPLLQQTDLFAIRLLAKPAAIPESSFSRSGNCPSWLTAAMLEALEGIVEARKRDKFAIEMRTDFNLKLNNFLSLKSRRWT